MLSFSLYFGSVFLAFILGYLWCHKRSIDKRQKSLYYTGQEIGKWLTSYVKGYWATQKMQRLDETQKQLALKSEQEVIEYLQESLWDSVLEFRQSLTSKTLDVKHILNILFWTHLLSLQTKGQIKENES